MQNDSNIPQQIKDRLDIVETLEKYMTLRKVGKNFSGVCPFHSEKTPSFMINPDIQRFKCYGCGKGGDVITFVQEIENLDFVEALEKLSKIAGIQFERGTRKINPLHKKIEEINNFATTYYEESLQNTNEAKSYLTNRGIKRESSEMFRIGFAPKHDALLKKLPTSLRSDTKLLIESGLFVQKDSGIKEKFRNRIMFPIHSSTGVIVGFSGRKLQNDDWGPKYLNTPETPIFHKSSLLYGVYQSKQSIRKEQYAILCEGQIDVISAHSLGITNIVAPLGTALADGQLQLLRRITERLLIIFDNDDAGQNALERAFILATKVGFKVFASNPRPYQDLDELIQKKPELANTTIKPKIDAYTYIITESLNTLNLTDLNDVNGIIKKHTQITQNVTEYQEMEFYNKRFRFLTKITPKTNQLIVKKPEPPREGAPQKVLSERINNEMRLLQLINENKLFNSLKQINTAYFTDRRVASLIDKIKDASCETVAEVRELKSISEHEIEIIDDLLYRSSSDSQNNDTKDEMNELYLRIKLNYYKKERDKYRTELAIAESSDNQEDIVVIMDKIGKINSTIQNLDDKISRL